MKDSACSSIAKVTSPPSPVRRVVAPGVAAQLGQHLLAKRQASSSAARGRDGTELTRG